MSFNLHFSRDLFLARTNSRLSQQDVAERTGISLREYQNIESGRRCCRKILSCRIDQRRQQFLSNSRRL